MIAALWMVGTLLSFSLMAVAAREVSESIDTIQLLFIRSAMGLCLISLIILSKQQSHLFKTHRAKDQIIRNVFHFAGQYGWFLGITLLPLAEVFALEFTVPLWTVLLAALFLNEKINSAKTAAIILGMVGVVLIVSPELDDFNWAAFIVIASAICYSTAYIFTKSLTRTDPPLTILFYMCLVQLPISAALLVGNWTPPSLLEWMWLLIVASTALSAHFCITQAMKLAEAGTVVIMDFLRLPLIACVGAVLYGETIEVGLMIGGLCMLAGNLINLRSQKKQSL